MNYATDPQFFHPDMPSAEERLVVNAGSAIRMVVNTRHVPTSPRARALLARIIASAADPAAAHADLVDALNASPYSQYAADILAAIPAPTPNNQGATPT